MRRWILIPSIIVLLMVSAVPAANSSLEGYVKDAKTGEPLIGANIIIVGTSMGGATDMDGKYVIPVVLPGSYTIRVTYIGYKEQKAEIQAGVETHIIKNFKLEPVGIEGQTVVVTAQASGQAQAINQQLTADQIVNVVSAAKIQELPDANAAESVGRLPGISVLRSGGEGYEVVIRGLEPKFNKIMIDGIQMSSSDPNDRSTDLSMISSNMLEGIQVSKTVTPDMDADVLGGTVNFELREARVKETGVPQFGLLVQGGYNGLPDAYNKYNDYKYLGSVEDRFLNDRLGIFAQIDIERKNLSSDEMGATYTNAGESATQYWTTGLNLDDIARDRERYNGAFVFDYTLPEGKIKLSNFLSSGNTTTIDRNENFAINVNTRYYNLTNTNSILNTINNALDFEQQLPIFQVDVKLSHTYSETKDPSDWEASFLQTSAGINQFVNKNNINPLEIPIAANNNFANTFLNTFENDNSFAKERALTGSIDLKTTLNISDLISAEIKFGGKYRYQTRSYEYDVSDGQSLFSGSSATVDGLINSYFSLPQSQQINIKYFMDPTFSYGKFLDGDYQMVAPLNLGMFSQISDLLKRNVQYIIDNNAQVSYSHDNYLSTTNNYSGNENQSAFYLMSIINIGPDVNIIPGVRYQDLITTYTAPRGITTTESWYTYNYYDTTVTQNHGYWLPDVSLKYKPLSWFDIRLAYSNTLAYPNYNAIIPRIDLQQYSITWENYKLEPSRSTNYDAYFSFYNNTIGMFTVGAFLKQIDNLIYPWTVNVTGAQVTQYLPFSLLTTYTPNKTYTVSTYLNDSYRINNYGMEFDWQTHFWYLPGPLSGLVFSANFTHIFSKAQYPYMYQYVSLSGRSSPPIDTSYINRLIDQPDDIVNLSLGFDYQGFSIRVSMLYQSDIFTGPNFWPQLNAHTSAYRRWDIAAKQDLPWFGIELYGDVNNLNGANDISVIQGGGVPTAEQDYGLTADLGLRWRF
jgi:TonB-dependent receptor